jgi:hypothetical protein
MVRNEKPGEGGEKIASEVSEKETVDLKESGPPELE